MINKLIKLPVSAIILATTALITGCNSGIGKEDNLFPNIITILADDMGFFDIGCFGSEKSNPTEYFVFLYKEKKKP